MSKTLATVGVGAAVVAGSMLAVTAASAHGGLSEEDRAARVSELAERFNLDEAEVETYFEEKRAERQAEREERRAEHIAGLVEDGVLTQDQADELVALKDGFREEIQALKESGAEREEIKALMEEKRAEVEAWAEDAGVDLEDIRPEKSGRRGHHGKFHDSSDDDSSDVDITTTVES